MENDVITWKKCNNCGFLQYISHLRCLKCKKNDFSVIHSSGTCKLLTYTILKAPPMEFRSQGSYALGVVEFENGIKAIGQITTMQNLEIGMKLKTIYKKICDNLDDNEVQAICFNPIGE